jgi:branched-chain amino acid transport system permease protein
MTYPVYRLFISAVCIGAGAGDVVGDHAHAAGHDDPRRRQQPRDGARLGIDIRLLYRVVFAAGVALAALAGMIAAPVSSVYPGMGSQVLIICFVVVVIGGIGSIRGALVAALLVGFVDTFGKVLSSRRPRHAGLPADGRDPAVEARRAVQGRY